jgi:hypothetical protein
MSWVLVHSPSLDIKYSTCGSEQLKRSKSSAPEANTEPPPIPQGKIFRYLTFFTTLFPCSSVAESFPPPDPIFTVGFDSNFAGHFGSEGADREYSILSAILGSPSPPDSATALQYPQGLSDSSWPVPQHQYGQSGQLSNGYSSGYSKPQISMQPPETNMSSTFMNMYPSSQRLSSSQDVQIQYPPQFPSHQSHPPSQMHQHQHQRYPDAAQDAAKETVTQSLISPPLSNHSRSSTTSAAVGGPEHIVAGGTSSLSTPSNGQLQSINDRVTAPYDYTEGYHFLMKHLHSRCVYC